MQRHQQPQQTEASARRSGTREKEPFLRQYHVVVFVVEDVPPDTATAMNARDQVWQRYGNTDGRFRVTRAEVRPNVRWTDPDGDVHDVDQLVFVCDYVAKGANANDATSKIRTVLDATGISVLDVVAIETARLRVELPAAVAEDLPTYAELRRRAGMEGE